MSALIPDIRLDDKYERWADGAFMSGTQVLARLPLAQSWRDKQVGLNTAGYISGYRGSPLGGYDAELGRLAEQMAAANIKVEPAVNEDLAATAVWGSQQANLSAEALYDGVFAAWYGKGPGVDRSGDALKHGNLAGTWRNGGVLVMAGDDHGAKSSTTAHQSDQALAAAFIPVLAPANVQELLDLGLMGWAQSRHSGLWIGLKCVTDVVESGASVSFANEPVVAAIPGNGAPSDLGIRLGDTVPQLQEERVLTQRLPAALEFAYANRIDRRIFGRKGAPLGLISSGKAFTDTVEALALLGLDPAAAESLGISLYKVGMPWPLEPRRITEFAVGTRQLIVIEEKRSLVEEQLARLLLTRSDLRDIRLFGKIDDEGRDFIPAHGELDPMRIALTIGPALARLDASGRITGRLDELHSLAQAARGVAASGAIRMPYFCSGCPHNNSTKLPAGSVAYAGIGCHAMATLMPTRGTLPPTQMGGEGANWVGQAPFTSTKHVFQNLGDGTYYHSGLMAVRAAVQSGVNITYKILFNDAVAMTGGQKVDGQLTVPDVAAQLRAEGVKTIVIVSDEPDKYGRKSDLPANFEVHHRDDLIATQQRLREQPGVTAMIYDQTCAAEKRRRRKRGQYPDPAKWAVINEEVCEGCGDCSLASNCVSVQPLETEKGLKRRIDLSSCNKDYLCVDGFCPSFVTVSGGKLRKPAPATKPSMQASATEISEPDLPVVNDVYSILVTGIGGTGIVTVGALLSMAAFLEGKQCTTLDVTGLAQKNGAVASHIRISANGTSVRAPRIGLAQTNLLLACDAVVAAGETSLASCRKGRTTAIVNDVVAPTGAFQMNPEARVDGRALLRLLSSTLGSDATHAISASALAEQRFGDTVAANLLLLGYAWQKGTLPLHRDSIFAAIDLNGVAVERNKAAFDYGRSLAAGRDVPIAPPTIEPQPIEQLIDYFSSELRAYQDQAYAYRYRSTVQSVADVDATLAGDGKLTEGVARNLFKLMAYKDEYEVARLFTTDAFAEKIRLRFEGNYRLNFHLAPPGLNFLGRKGHAPGKMTFGPWVMTLFRLLARLRRLRGSRFDPFGYHPERRLERSLIREYETLVAELLRDTAADNYALATQLANTPATIKGFGHVKLRNVDKARKAESDLLAQFRQRVAARGAVPAPPA